jgi:hypothetical protein
VDGFIYTKVLELFLQIACQTEKKNYETKSRYRSLALVFINLAETLASVLLSAAAQVPI